MTDRIRESFLRVQQKEGVELANASALLDLVPFGDEDPPDCYIAKFSCQGLVKHQDGSIGEANRFNVGISFPQDYLISVDPISICTWLEPREIFHPNISEGGPFLCLGKVTPGTSLTDLLYRIFEVISWSQLVTVETDALNWGACQWARHHPHRYPVDRRPLKWIPQSGDQGQGGEGTFKK